MQAEQTRTERIAAIKKSIADLDARKKRLIRTLEVTGDDDEEPDQELIQDIKTRRTEIKAERAKRAAELETLEEQVNDQQNPRPALLAPGGHLRSRRTAGGPGLQAVRGAPVGDSLQQDGQHRRLSHHAEWRDTSCAPADNTAARGGDPLQEANGQEA
jgi:hypothetical protein